VIFFGPFVPNNVPY